MNLGKIIGESIDAYHAGDAISHTKLEVFRKRPELFRRRFISKTVEPERTAAFDVGSALHCAVLEPEQYESRFIVNTRFDSFRTTEAKAWRIQCEVQGVTILSIDDAAIVEQMKAAILGQPESYSLLTGGESEVSWRVRSNDHPVPLQCRTDKFQPFGCAVSSGRPCVADIKTVDSLDAEEFRNFDGALKKFGYHRAAGLYIPILRGCGVRVWDWYFIVVEKREPFGCEVFRLTEDAIEKGKEEVELDLTRLSLCYKTGVWPNGRPGVQDIGLPSNYRSKEFAA